MRYVSENFKAVMNEVIRPPLQLHFEVDTNILNAVNVDPDYAEDLNFDDTVAPIVTPENCLNERYYAVLGDGKPVDDPNRMCAGGFSPDISVPYGVTAYTAANTEVLIGNPIDADYFNNFNYFPAPAILSFKGGLIPDVIRVEVYDSEGEAWETERTIYNSELKEEVEFIPDNHYNWSDFRRFYVKNTTTAGRFQFNWIMLEKGKARTPSVEPVSFDNSYIASIDINTETDLTSQTLPEYEMTIECIDVDEVYTPDSTYWKNQFIEGTECYLKIGYEIGEGVESLPFFYGKLTKIPTYSQGKITFNVAFDMTDLKFSAYSSSGYSVGEGIVSIFSKYDQTVQVGEETKSYELNDLLEWCFKEYDVFADADDVSKSTSNYYGELKANDFRQLVANALGGYIRVDFDKCCLKKTTDIQYASFDDYLTRYEQIKNTLDVQNKISRTVVPKKERTVSEEYYRSMGTNVGIDPEEIGYSTFVIPFYAIGRLEVETGVATIYDISDEILREDGHAKVEVGFYNPTQAQIAYSPILHFYRVEDEEFALNRAIEGDIGEEYTNNNTLISNEHTAKKVFAVADFINGISDQYEVDVVQNYQYELGDVIRLETRTGVFKTCVITGLKYVMPGSSGHITCRRIFSFEDIPEVESDHDVTLHFGSDLILINHNHNEEDLPFVVGYITDYANSKQYLYVLGGKDNYYDSYSANICKITVTDKNGHAWEMVVLSRSITTPPTFVIPYITLPNYQGTEMNNGIAYGAIELIKAVYAEQGMNAPVDYTCAYVIE